MKIVEITDRSAALTAVGEGSGRATPLFLPEAEIRRIRGGVPQAVAAVERSTVAADEQIPPTVGLYAHMGSAVIGRAERGGPYPLPIMALR